MPLKDLLYGMIIQSGNDAAIALAEHVAGSEQGFAALMNAYAKQLGMTGTHYSNASGYPVPDHYTTARDVAVLSRALIHDFPADYAISAIKEFQWNGITQHNRNTLLWRDPSVDGIKTGHTSEAGYCLAASAKRGDQRLIAIVMGTPSEQARADDAEALLNYGFRFYETHKVYAAGKALSHAAPVEGRGRQAADRPAQRRPLVTIPRGEYKQAQGQHGHPRSADRAVQEGPEDRHPAHHAGRQDAARAAAGGAGTMRPRAGSSRACGTPSCCGSTTATARQAGPDARRRRHPAAEPGPGLPVPRHLHHHRDGQRRRGAGEPGAGDPAQARSPGAHRSHDARVRRARATYIAVTVDFDCERRDEYDAAHAALRADPDIRYTL